MFAQWTHWARRLALMLAAATLLAPAAHASHGVYFSSFGAPYQDINKYPLEPHHWGTFFSDNASTATELVVAGDTLYWLEDKAVWMQNIDGSGKTRLQQFGIAPLSLAVDVSNGFYYASFGGGYQDINKYPLTPGAWGTWFSDTGIDARHLTVAGDKLYWLEDKAVWMQNLDGSGKTRLQLFGVAPIDLAVDVAGGHYYTSFGGSFQDINKYPLSPGAWGSWFSDTHSNAHGLTIVGDHIYWLDGKEVWMQGLDGQGKTLVQRFGIAPTDLAVHITPVPEPGAIALGLAGLMVVAIRRRGGSVQ